MEIKGKVAVVTGSSRGVGRATALALAKKGCSVAINYSRSKEEAEETAQLVHAMGVEVAHSSSNVQRNPTTGALLAESSMTIQPHGMKMV